MDRLLEEYAHFMTEKLRIYEYIYHLVHCLRLSIICCTGTSQLVNLQCTMLDWVVLQVYITVRIKGVFVHLVSQTLRLKGLKKWIVKLRFFFSHSRCPVMLKCNTWALLMSARTLLSRTACPCSQEFGPPIQRSPAVFKRKSQFLETRDRKTLACLHMPFEICLSFFLSQFSQTKSLSGVGMQIHTQVGNVVLLSTVISCLPNSPLLW